MFCNLAKQSERDIRGGHSRQEKLNAGISLSYILMGRKANIITIAFRLQTCRRTKSSNMLHF